MFISRGVEVVQSVTTIDKPRRLRGGGGRRGGGLDVFVMFCIFVWPVYDYEEIACGREGEIITSFLLLTPSRAVSTFEGSSAQDGRGYV